MVESCFSKELGSDRCQESLGYMRHMKAHPTRGVDGIMKGLHEIGSETVLFRYQGSKDNGSKISSFLLEWDEGKGEEFKSCYSGSMKQHKIFKLMASTKYSFRLAAKNNFGFSNFSEIAVFYTSGNTPPAPLPPKLKEAGVYSLSLEWCAPTNPNPNDTLTYVLEMEEPRSGLGFKPKYNGEDLSCTVRNLQRNTAYKFRIPKCNGAEITDYRLQWGQIEDSMHLIYTGPCLRYEVKGLIPATTYFCRVQAVNIVGVGMFGGTGKVTTPGTVPAIVPMLQEVEDKVPAKLSSSCIAIQWEEPDCHGSPITGYNIEYGDKKILTVDRVTECVLKNLQPNTTYRFSVIYHGPDLTHKVQKLSEYTQYKFKIQACNEAGEGPQSDVYTFTTTKTPPAALKAPKLHPLNNNSCEIKWDSLNPVKGDPIIYCLQVITGKKAEQIYKGPNTTFCFSNYLANSRYRFKVCAGRQYENSDGVQELWGPYSPSTLFSTYKHQSGHGKGGGGKGKGNHNDKDEKYKTEMRDDTFVLILMIGFALIAILCAVAIQYFLIN
ncbi:fibronectin type III domain containing protein 3C1 isoform 2 [Cricetulus griseus]|uniref:Fibronectin type III domain containing protein 3C1 isoform 2 n=1 Tax=Cricetulus griseus TaxID=10029 RepID=A0A061HXV4_CRIGR|nr:fibronectin type III domain containing protein 3C1 isoform 2 [Cricetulus griseus]